MISVTIRKNRNNEYVGFKCKGHAEYADSGTDIVCAAVSMLVINTINAIDELTDCAIVTKQDAKKGFIDIVFPDKVSKEASLLMDAMVLGINGVSNQYGKTYVTVKFKEV